MRLSRTAGTLTDDLSGWEIPVSVVARSAWERTTAPQRLVDLAISVAFNEPTEYATAVYFIETQKNVSPFWHAMWRQVMPHLCPPPLLANLHLIVSHGPIQAFLLSINRILALQADAHYVCDVIKESLKHPMPITARNIHDCVLTACTVMQASITIKDNPEAPVLQYPLCGVIMSETDHVLVVLWMIFGTSQGEQLPENIKEAKLNILRHLDESKPTMLQELLGR